MSLLSNQCCYKPLRKSCQIEKNTSLLSINTNKLSYLVIFEVKFRKFHLWLSTFPSQAMTQTIIKRCWETGKANKLYFNDMKYYYDLYIDSHNGSFLIWKNIQHCEASLLLIPPQNNFCGTNKVWVSAHKYAHILIQFQ